MMLLPMILAATVASATSPAKRPDCKPLGPELTAGPSRGGFRKLGELPPANHVLALFRTVDNCSVPVIVRYGIGSGEGPAR